MTNPSDSESQKRIVFDRFVYFTALVLGVIFIFSYWISHVIYHDRLNVHPFLEPIVAWLKVAVLLVPAFVFIARRKTSWFFIILLTVYTIIVLFASLVTGHVRRYVNIHAENGSPYVIENFDSNIAFGGTFGSSPVFLSKPWGPLVYRVSIVDDCDFPYGNNVLMCSLGLSAPTGAEAVSYVQKQIPTMTDPSNGSNLDKAYAIYQRHEPLKVSTQHDALGIDSFSVELAAPVEGSIELFRFKAGSFKFTPVTTSTHHSLRDWMTTYPDAVGIIGDIGRQNAIRAGSKQIFKPSDLHDIFQDAPYLVKDGVSYVPKKFDSDNYYPPQSFLGEDVDGNLLIGYDEANLSMDDLSGFLVHLGIKWKWVISVDQTKYAGIGFHYMTKPTSPASIYGGYEDTLNAVMITRI